MKTCLIRAFRTFIQAAVGYASVNIVYAFSSSDGSIDTLKTALTGLVISAVSAGLAAIMNLPNSKAKAQTESKEENHG